MPASLSTLWTPSGEAVAIFGLNILRPGVGEVWGIVDDRARKCRGPFIRAAIETKELAFRALKLWRIQAAIDETFKPGILLAEAAGFVCETRLASYIVPGSDSLIFSEVRP